MEQKLVEAFESGNEGRFVELLGECDAAYNTENRLLADEVYDMWRHRGEERWPENSFFAEIHDLGGDVSHDGIVVGSLRKMRPDAIYKLMKANEGKRYILMEKVDGVSLVIKFKNGVLDSAVTRGDGETGRDVLASARHFISADLRSADATIRGEVIWTGPCGGTGRYVDSKSAAVGILGSGKDVEAMRMLKFIAYELIAISGDVIVDTRDYRAAFEFLASCGLNIVPYEEMPPFESQNAVTTIERVLNQFIERHETHPDYNIDGCVICPIPYARENVKRPLLKVAYKNPRNIEVATVTGIEVNVGKTGRLVPVVLVTPIRIGPSTIARVTGSTFGVLAAKRIGVGAKIRIQLNVVPVILDTVEPATQIFVPPTACPACGGAVSTANGVSCANPECAASRSSRIASFIAAIGVKGFGLVRIKQMQLETLEDLYGSTPADFAATPKIGDKLADQLYTGIRARIQNIDPATFLDSLGIRNLGVRLSKKLIESLGGIRPFLDAETFDEIDGRLETHSDVREALRASFGTIKEEIALLTQHGLSFREGAASAAPGPAPAAAVPAGAPAPATTAVVSGKSTVSRWKTKGDLVEEVERTLGWQFSDNLTKATNVLVCDPAEDSGKIKMARKYGTRIVSFEELAGMM
jgi:DNA ligase (NAD+)